MIFKTQKEMFDWIWEDRLHKSELSGLPLYPKGHFKWHWQFLHVLPKGTYPHYKLNSDNILLALPDEHENQEMFSIFQEKKSELKQQYYKTYYGKEFEL